MVRFAAWLAAAAFVLAGAMLSYEVVARYFFTRPTIWAAELSQLCLIWGAMLAMAALLEQRRHIQVDAVVRLLSQSLQRWMDVFAMLVVAAFSAVVAVYGFTIFHDSFERGRTTGSLLNIPQWIAELAIPLGFTLLFIQALIEVARAWNRPALSSGAASGTPPGTSSGGTSGTSSADAA